MTKFGHFTFIWDQKPSLRPIGNGQIWSFYLNMETKTIIKAHWEWPNMVIIPLYGTKNHHQGPLAMAKFGNFTFIWNQKLSARPIGNGQIWSLYLYMEPILTIIKAQVEWPSGMIFFSIEIFLPHCERKLSLKSFVSFLIPDVCFSPQGALGDASKLSATLTVLANDDPYGQYVISATNRPSKTREANTGQYITQKHLKPLTLREAKTGLTILEIFHLQKDFLENF